jgi:hypothetical protein
MHPELLSSLATEHHRDLRSVAAARPAPRRPRAVRRPLGAHRFSLLPRLRVSWTHTSLAAVSGRRGNSVMIVISATRPG